MINLPAKGWIWKSKNAARNAFAKKNANDISLGEGVAAVSVSGCCAVKVGLRPSVGGKRRDACVSSVAAVEFSWTACNPVWLGFRFGVCFSGCLQRDGGA